MTVSAGNFIVTLEAGVTSQTAGPDHHMQLTREGLNYQKA